MERKRYSKREFVTGVLTVLCGTAGLVLFLLSYRTGYYSFGEMNSLMILMFFLVGIAMEIFTLIALKKWGGAFWVSFLTFAVTALFCAGAILLVGDRVEGIGNCIVTDYDAGHGGEEAIYRSLAGAAVTIIGVFVNVAGSFAGPVSKKKDGKQMPE